MNCEILRSISFVFECLGDYIIYGFFGSLKYFFADVIKFIVVLFGIFGICQSLFQILDSSARATGTMQPTAPSPRQNQPVRGSQ